MSRPLKLDLSVARHLVGRLAQRSGRFPLVTMLEPLEACNLTCTGCGRVREYRDVIDRAYPDPATRALVLRRVADDTSHGPVSFPDDPTGLPLVDRVSPGGAYVDKP